MTRFISSLGLAYRPGMILALLALALQLTLPAVLVNEVMARPALAAPWPGAALCLAPDPAHEGGATPPLSRGDARHGALHHGLCLLCQAASGTPLLIALTAPVPLPPGERREARIPTTTALLNPALRPKGSARGPPAGISARAIPRTPEPFQPRPPRPSRRGESLSWIPVMTFRHLVLSACLSTSALAAASLVPVPAARAATQSVRVEHAWSRATPGTSTEGVVYATIVATAADRLTSVSSPVAADAQLHENLTTDGVMKMRPIAGLDLAPGKPVKLAPGGYHIMLDGLKSPLAAGQKFPVTFHFEKAGDVTATVAVQALDATGPAAKQSGTAMKGMDMKGMDMGNGD